MPCSILPTLIDIFEVRLGLCNENDNINSVNNDNSSDSIGGWYSTDLSGEH